MSKDNIGFFALGEQARAMSDPSPQCLLGKTLESVTMTDAKDHITFKTDDGASYSLTHFQDCCESVHVEEVIGDLADLVGSPITEAEEVSSDGHPDPKGCESFTWTFYKFGTAKGFVTIRWLGESNGYYSESVDFVRDQ